MDYLLLKLRWIGQPLKWLLVSMCYLAVLSAEKWLGFIVLASVMGLSVYLVQLDKERETKGDDHFWGEGLFYRYGSAIEDISVPIPIKPDWSREQTRSFAADLRQRLASRLLVKLPDDHAQVLAPLSITEQKTQQAREFLRILIRSPYDSRLTFFLHFAPFGSTVAAQYVAYIRGRFSDWDVVKFALLSPFTIWAWLIPWMLNRYSLCAAISHYAENDFDVIDLQGIHTATRNLVLTELEKLLAEDGMLSETLRQVFNFCITNNNTQNMNIKGSRNVFGPIGQSAVVSSGARP